VFRTLQVKLLSRRGPGPADEALGSVPGLARLLLALGCEYRDTGYHLRLAAVNMPPHRPRLFQP